MNKKHYFFFAAVVGMAMFAQYDATRRLDNIKLAKMQKSSQTADSLAGAKTTEAGRQVAAAEPIVPPEVFVEKFKAEAAQIGKIQNNPAAAQARLKKLAEKMRPSDVVGMYDVISNDKANADQRALAVELLALKNDTTSMMALQNFVANKKNVNGQNWDQKKEFETVLRAQAVEGIAAYPEREIALSTLSYLQQKVDQKFLSDRISRVSMGLMYEAKPVIQQDEEALKKLVE